MLTNMLSKSSRLRPITTKQLALWATQSLQVLCWLQVMIVVGLLILFTVHPQRLKGILKISLKERLWFIVYHYCSGKHFFSLQC